MASEEELQNMAKEELLRDVKCAAIRAEQFGAHRWAKPQALVANKRFLRHMLLGNARRDKADRSRSSSRHKKSSETSKRDRSVETTNKKHHHSSHKHKSEHASIPEKVKREKIFKRDAQKSEEKHVFNRKHSKRH